MTKSLQIQSSQNTYEVLFLDTHQHLNDQLKKYTNAVKIIDANVAALYPSLMDERCLVFDAVETLKTLEGVQLILQFLQSKGASKSTAVIAIGGGIVQDVASFAAHIYYRGVSFIFVPTTLLAMADSCIGSKCGLNYNGFKNQIGAFHPPEKVLIDLTFLKTLSQAEVYSGYGEIFKLLLIGGHEPHHTLQVKNADVLECIFQSLAVKKSYIEEDELDVGNRRILNYGHTFGHALELATDYKIPHGIAVAWGIDMVNFIAYQNKLLSKEKYEKIHQFIKENFPCDFSSTVSAQTLIENAKKDKKAQEGKINMVFLKESGEFCLNSTFLDQQLCTILDNYLREESGNE